MAPGFGFGSLFFSVTKLGKKIFSVMFKTVVWIRKFLGLRIRKSEERIRIPSPSGNISKRTLDFSCLLSDVLPVKNYVNIPLKSNSNRAGSGAGFGSVSQRYGSEDPDPLQNATNPEHWFKKHLSRSTFIMKILLTLCL